LKPSSVRANHRVLHAALEQARKWKMISENPARDAKAPAARKTPVKDFTVEQVGRLLGAAASDPETYCITALFLTCGIRRSELLGLALDAVDFDAGKIRIKRVVIEVRGTIDPDTGQVTKKRQKIVREVLKTEASAREITVPEPMLALLREQRTRVQEMALKWGKGYQREPMFLFPGVSGEAGQPQNLLNRMRAVMRTAKVTGRSPCHAWRHTSATQLLDSGQNIKTVQRRLGHASLTSTAIYLHPVDARDAEAANNLGALLNGAGKAVN
jgi:integrase